MVGHRNTAVANWPKTHLQSWIVLCYCPLWDKIGVPNISTTSDLLRGERYSPV